MQLIGVVKNNIKRYHIPFSRVPSKVTFYITMEQYHSQEIGIDTIHPPCSDFTSFYSLICEYVYSALCNVQCDHHHSQNSGQSHDPRTSHVTLIVALVSPCFYHFISSPYPMVITNLLPISIIMLFCDCYIDEIL